MKKIAKLAVLFIYIIGYCLYYRHLPILKGKNNKLQTNKNEVDYNWQLINYVKYWDNFNIELYNKVKLANSQP